MAIQQIEQQSNYVFAFADQGNELECVLGSVIINMVVDSGSRHNIIDKGTWDRLKLMHVCVTNMQQRSTKVFKVYGGAALDVVGSFTAKIATIGKETSAQFFVVNQNEKPLLGLDTASALGVLEIYTDTEVATIEKVKPLSKIKNVMFKLLIDESVPPVSQPYRRVPVALEKAVNIKINELVAMDVEEPVSGHTIRK